MEKITASEAVFGFAAWVTCRTDVVKAGATEDAAVWAEMAAEWCKENDLPQPREGIYPQNITQPAD